MKIKTIGYLVTGLILFSQMSSLSAADPRTPEMLSNTCAGCHGTNGASAGGPMPVIAGLSKRYISQALNDYKSGKRPSTIMGRIARGYSELEIEAIASHLAAQNWHTQQEVKPKKSQVKLGQKLHNEQCETCHLDGGRGGKDPDMPRLAGQYPDYLFNQLREFHDIGGTLPQPREMRLRIEKLSAEELKALSQFYASQK